MIYIKDVLKRLYFKCRDIFVWVISWLPTDYSKIVFINFEGKGYGDNPKYIAEELKKSNKDIEFVWFVENSTVELPDGIKGVKYQSLSALIQLATARIIVTNTKRDLRIYKKSSQKVIQTWHGSCSFKYIESDAIDTLPSSYIRESIKNSKQTDLFLSSSKNQTDEYKRAFWCESEILEVGLPRNDLFFKADDKFIEEIKKKAGIKSDVKIALYAPTFRDDGSTECYDIDLNKMLKKLKETGNDWLVLIRMHPKAKGIISSNVFSEEILDATSYPDMQELLLIADLLITDYSSTIYDFALMRKPILLYTPDIIEYQRLRGLKNEYFDLPWKKNKSTDALIDEIENSLRRGKEYANRFMDLYGSFDEGRASNLVASKILSWIEVTH